MNMPGGDSALAAKQKAELSDLLLQTVNDVLIKYGKPSIAELDSQ